MNNKEKVIKALEKCSSRDCPTCPYYSPNDSRCIRELIYDALTLLKKQEDEIRELRLVLQIIKGTGIKVDTEGR